MAARKNRIRHDDNTRNKIRASQLINRLQKCVEGEVELDSTQVSAAKALLNKVLPDLQSAQIDMDATHHSVTDKPMDVDSWEKQYTEETTH